MTELPVIAGLWIGSNLSWLEQVCVKSYIDNGHKFILYTVKDIAGIPDGVDVRHANEIFYPPPFDIEDNDRLRVSLYSNIFRMHLLQKTDYIWVDMDAYCVQAFRFQTPYIFAKSHKDTIPTGVMRLPKDSATIRAILNFITSPNPVQPWRGNRLHQISKQRIANNERWGIEDLPWGSSGPKAFTYFLNETGEVSHAMEPHVFYPLSPEELWKLHAPNLDISEIERDGVYSVHIYGHQKKIIANMYNGLPVAASYLAQVCKRHGIDPRDAILKPLVWM